MFHARRWQALIGTTFPKSCCGRGGYRFLYGTECRWRADFISTRILSFRMADDRPRLGDEYFSAAARVHGAVELHLRAKTQIGRSRRAEISPRRQPEGNNRVP